MMVFLNNLLPWLSAGGAAIAMITIIFRLGKIAAQNEAMAAQHEELKIALFGEKGHPGAFVTRVEHATSWDHHVREHAALDTRIGEIVGEIGALRRAES